MQSETQLNGKSRHRLSWNWSTKRRLVTFFKFAYPICNLLGLFLIIGSILILVPIDIIKSEPSTGGDIGSHFWPLYVLVKKSLPEWHIRTINPGNLGGEPHFVHYFPLPFLIMAAIAQVLPVETAFNIGIFLSVLILPLCIFIGVRGLGYRFPAPIICAAFSLFFLLNESYTMWGGNVMSTLAGQFGHTYALGCLFLGMGSLGVEIRKNLPPVMSSVLFACVALSHAYVFLGVPFFCLSMLFCFPFGLIRKRFKIIFISGSFSVLLSLWFLIPMVSYSQWTTPFVLVWKSPNIFTESTSPILYPAIIIIIVITILCGIFKISRRLFQDSKFYSKLKACVFAKFFTNSLFWLIPVLGYVGMFFMFPRIGLVDVRAIPQILVCIAVFGGICTAVILNLYGRVLSFLCVLPVVFASMWWSGEYNTNLTTWLVWNYSGWSAKVLYKDLLAISNELKGDFSDARVIYEHNLVNESAGTLRVFEMLPYFAGRATLESVYMQATILAPMVYYLQAEISKTPSCPYQTTGDCPSHNVIQSIPHLKLFGVKDIITVTKEVRAQADKAVEQGMLVKGKDFGPWHLYHMANPSNLISTFTEVPELINSQDWKSLFFAWFKMHTGKERYLLADGFVSDAVKSTLSNENNSSSIWRNSSCQPSIEVDFAKIVIHTPCPGAAHILRFAFSPIWKADTKDELFLVSPGFIGLIPSKDRVVLTYQMSNLWYLASIVSLFSLVGIMVYLLAYRFQKL